MKIPLCLLLAVVAPCALSQVLAPELAPTAAKYHADIATLEGQRAGALEQAQKPYLAALGTAEKSATTAGNVAGVAAIATERAALGSGLIAPRYPTDMPKELQTPRKTYFDAHARIKTTETSQRQAIDAAYLRALTNLKAGSSKNPELGTQLDAERQKLLASAVSTTASKPGTKKSAVINGNFDLANAEGQPSGWTTLEEFKVVRDGTNNVIRASSKAPVHLSITQDLVVPPKERVMTLKGRIRGKIVARAPNQEQGGVLIYGVWVDSQEKASSAGIILDGGSGDEWQNLSTTVKIPDDMKLLRVALFLKNVSGEFDFDDIEVEFR
jgi:hypothetical protein